MTDEKIREVLDGYHAHVMSRLRMHDEGVQPLQLLTEVQLHHLLNMIPAMRALVKRDALLCSLGFVQGVLWAGGICTLDEMRAHNEPDIEGPAW